jgi:1,2-phenylacetyl-CoA epoxidase PaaB subunit
MIDRRVTVYWDGYKLQGTVINFSRRHAGADYWVVTVINPLTKFPTSIIRATHDCFDPEETE